MAGSDERMKIAREGADSPKNDSCPRSNGSIWHPAGGHGFWDNNGFHKCQTLRCSEKNCLFTKREVLKIVRDKPGPTVSPIWVCYSSSWTIWLHITSVMISYARKWYPCGMWFCIIFPIHAHPRIHSPSSCGGIFPSIMCSESSTIVCYWLGLIAFALHSSLLIS